MSRIQTETPHALGEASRRAYIKGVVAGPKPDHRLQTMMKTRILSCQLLRVFFMSKVKPSGKNHMAFTPYSGEGYRHWLGEPVSPSSRAGSTLRFSPLNSSF